MTYSEKLKDPRWQKKRLEILERDEWTCQGCSATDKTLHIHHIRYDKRCNPWNYPDEMLMTLCEECHEWVYRTNKYGTKLTISGEILDHIHEYLNNSWDSGNKIHDDAIRSILCNEKFETTIHILPKEKE